MHLWLTKDSVFHPRGYYRLALSLSQRFSLQVWGRPFSPLQIEGPLAQEIDSSVLEALTQPPSPPPNLTIRYLTSPFTSFLHRCYGEHLICNPSDLPWGLLRRPLIWDIWEDYQKNFLEDPAYTRIQSSVRIALWKIGKRLKSLPKGYTLAEYTYASLVPLSRSRILPNAFVKVEEAPPLLPALAQGYFLYTGNLTESWGVLEAIKAALEKPTHPLVIAGSLKSQAFYQLLRGYLQHHKAWLWIWSLFVPYPLIQNLQRHAKLMYGLYHPLPHLRDKIPSKFYEAAALGIPLLYPESRSRVWDAFWRRYRGSSGASELYWHFYERELLEWVEILRSQS
ncbi:MAG: hypothetical protein RMK19_03760 [Bacteroidia bacterium]|nr:hypothetical protein [Bacteroidia bacterium]MDW8015107.1 hypothetical protein [Bacteroidia bacterium]